MKWWMWTILVGLLVLILKLLLIKKPNGDGMLKLLDNWKIALQHKITVIDKRQKKREKLIKIMENYEHELDKNVSRMSDDDLDKYINAFK